MDYEKSAYSEIYEISTQLDQIRNDINIQRAEIFKCENFIKPYQIAIHTLNNSINQLIKTKSELKDKRTKLVNEISYNCDEEPNFQHIAIKGEMFENSTTESLASYNFNSVNNENIQSHDLDSDPISKHDQDLQDDQSQCKDETTILNESQCNQSDASVNKISLKRKRTESSFASEKSEIPIILQFKRRLLSQILNCRSGILISGNRGMIQLRDKQNLKIIRKFIDFQDGTISRLVITTSKNSTVILASSQQYFVCFDMNSGKVVYSEQFASEITSLKCMDQEIFIGLISGSFYTFRLRDCIYLGVVKITGSYVQSNIKLKFKGKSINLMGCQDGQIYQPGNKSSDPFSIIKYPCKNIYDMIFLSGGSYILAYSDTMIHLINKNTLGKTTSYDIETQIRKVAANDKNIFAVLSDGKISTYKIKKGLPDFSNKEEFNTYDSTVKDINVNDDEIYLIGDENVYYWKL